MGRSPSAAARGRAPSSRSACRRTPSPASEHSRVATILIVDDEEIHARALGRFFDRRGHTCEVVISAPAALAAVRAGRPQLVLLDMRLGEVDGLETLREMRELEPTLPVVVMTGFGSVETAGRALKAGTLAGEAFIALDCTALPRSLIEAELFGYERGAFTDAKSSKRGLFEVATGGTIFLDEIGELDLEVQGKLLRAIEEKKVRRLGGLSDCRVDARIIAATNRDLGRLATEGRFRLDLLYRLNVLTLTLPPLREREEDIALLAAHFIGICARKYDRPPKRLTPEAVAALTAFPWIGNVRELAHVIERAMLLVEGETLEGWQLGLESRLPDAEPSPSAPATLPAPAPETLEGMERQLLQQALESNAWNISRAARRLGVSRELLRYRMRKYAMTPPGR